MNYNKIFMIKKQNVPDSDNVKVFLVYCKWLNFTFEGELINLKWYK